MANADTYIGIDRGKEGFKIADFTIQGSAPSTDFYFRFNALDAQSKTIRRIDAIKALEAIERVLGSGAIFTTEMAE